MARRCRFKAVTIREFGNNTRSGLSARTAPNVQMAISPLTCNSFSNGFAPSCPVKAGITRNQMPTTRLEILAKAHSDIEIGDLLFVTVEHQRRLLAGEKTIADHPPRCLAP